MADRILTCAECGVEFQPSRNQWEKRNKGNRSFCSHGCMVAGNRKSSNAWWNANPDANTVTRPTVSCAYCQKEFTASPHQHQKRAKEPDAAVYCTKECHSLSMAHADIRANALKWMRENPEVGGLYAARILGIPYVTLHRWRKAEGMVVNNFEYRTAQTCGCCGKEFWPSSSQWQQREERQSQVCSEECRRGLFSARRKGVPRPKIRKHGLYSLEMKQVNQVRKAIYNFIEEGAKA